MFNKKYKTPLSPWRLSDDAQRITTNRQRTIIVKCKYISDKMAPKFTDDEIRGHLAELGYTNIPEERLRVFVNDLRRLMKYEEKKRRLAGELEELKNRTPRQQKSTRSGYFYAVLWIRNDLFHIQLRIFRVPDPDPTHVI